MKKLALAGGSGLLWGGGWELPRPYCLSRSDIMCATSATVSCCPNRAVPPRLTPADRMLYNQIPGRAFFSLAAFVRFRPGDGKAIREERHNAKWRSQDLQMTADGAVQAKIYFLGLYECVCVFSCGSQRTIVDFSGAFHLFFVVCLEREKISRWPGVSYAG